MNFGAWLWEQARHALLAVLHVVFLGTFQAIRKRIFSWRAFFSHTLLTTLGVFGAGYLTLRAGGPDHLLWVGVLGAVTLSAVIAGVLARRPLYWELQWSTLIVGGIVFVHLWKGWHNVLPMSDEPSLELFFHRTPGDALLGGQWREILGLGLGAALTLGVFGASLGYLFLTQSSRSARLEWELCSRMLLGKSDQSLSATALVALGGVAVGVAALVAVTSVMSGYQQDIEQKILDTNAHISIQKYGVDFVEYDDVIQKVRTVDNVIAASPFTYNEALLSDGAQSTSVLVKGVDPATAGGVTGVQRNLCRMEGDRCVLGGATLSELLPDEEPRIILGKELFRKLGKPVGGRVVVTTPVGVPGGKSMAPKRMQFTVAGVFKSGIHEFDSHLAYVHFRSAQQLMGLGKAVRGVEVKIQDHLQVDVVSNRILDKIDRYPFHITDWRDLNASIFTALKITKITMFLVLTFIVIVAAFNIASTLFMAVVEKSHAIGLLKALGATDASIMKVFIMEGWLVGGVGTIVGILLGLGFALALGQLDIGIAPDVYMVDRVTVRILPQEVLLTAACALVISHLATLYPALRAARQAPVDALRME